MPKRRLFIGVFALMLAVGCAGGQAPVSQAAATSSAQHQSRLAQDLVAVLRGDGVSVEDAEFNGGLSADETLRRFDKQSGGVRYSCTPEVYALKVTASPSPDLPPGSIVRMVYVPDVQDAFEGVAPPPGASESWGESPPAHMFAFFDGDTGRFIETTYVTMEE